MGCLFGPAYILARTFLNPFPFTARGGKDVREDVEFPIHGGTADLVGIAFLIAAGHPIVAPPPDDLRRNVSDEHFAEAHTIDHVAADGGQAEAFPALAALVDRYLKRIAVQRVLQRFGGARAKWLGVSDFHLTLSRQADASALVENVPDARIPCTAACTRQTCPTFFRLAILKEIRK